VLRLTHAPYVAQLCGIPVCVIVGFFGNKFGRCANARAKDGKFSGAAVVAVRKASAK
jgi:hypothetical protein